MAKSSTTLKEGQCLPPRGKGNKGKVLDGIMQALPECANQEEAEKAYFKHVAVRAFNPDDKDSSTLLRLLADKGWGSVKPTLGLIEFDFPVTGTPTEKAIAIVDAIAGGVIAPDIGQMMIGIIKDAVIIEEGTDLKARIEKLEEMINK